MWGTIAPDIGSRAEKALSPVDRFLDKDQEERALCTNDFALKEYISQSCNADVRGGSERQVFSNHNPHPKQV
jgi:hypothetical protein